MFTRLAMGLAVLMLLAGTGLRAADAPSKEDIAKAEKAVRDELTRLKAGERHRVSVVSNEALARAFPGCVFIGVLFPQYPVGIAPPAPLRESNVFVVPKEGKAEFVSDTKALEKYFLKNLPAAKDEGAMKDAARAWLRLSQELHQDGFYKFQLMDDSTKVSKGTDGLVASGKVVVMQGGNGEINVAMTFEEVGKLTKLSKITEKAELKPGPRPICQATKLLDADPIVRRMAEQDLLIMGRFARPYLDEQRAKASPELQRAIDRLWQRIVEEGR